MFYWFSYRFKTIFLLLLLAGAVGTSYYFYDQNQKTIKLLKNPKEASEEEKRQLIGKVGALMEIPTDEEPSVATVLDEEKIKGQPFFEKAKAGDKVLVFEKAKEAIIFRPSSGKIIKVGPVDTSAAEAAKYTVSLYSAGSDLDSLDTVESDLKEKIDNLEFTTRGTTKQSNYTKKYVVDIKGDKKEVAASIAKEIGGIVISLPSGETKPDADFMVIVP